MQFLEKINENDKEVVASSFNTVAYTVAENNADDWRT